jgi:hypothetical protein
MKIGCPIGRGSAHEARLPLAMALNEISAASKKGLSTLSSNRTVRMTPQYRQRLERAALHRRVTVSAFLDLAVVAYAKQHEFYGPARKR